MGKESFAFGLGVEPSPRWMEGARVNEGGARSLAALCTSHSRLLILSITYAATFLLGGNDDDDVIMTEFCPVLIPCSARYSYSYYASRPGFTRKLDLSAVEYRSLISY